MPRRRGAVIAPVNNRVILLFYIFVADTPPNPALMNKSMNYKQLTALCLFTLLLLSCTHKTVFKLVQVPGSFSVSIPAYMAPASDLCPGRRSAVQYASDSAEAYLFIIDTLRKNMRENNLHSFYDSMVVGNVGDSGMVQPPARFAILHQDSTLYTERRAMLQSNGVVVFYRIEVVASPSRFYYIQLWTSLKNKAALKNDFDRILDSFTAVNR